MKNLFCALTKGERLLWLGSALVIVGAFALSPAGSVLSLVASLIGVSALIFVAKGLVIGQILTVVFAVFYGIISFYFQYYGEMITYLGMTAPIAILSVVSWVRNPFEGTSEVTVRSMNYKQIAVMWGLSITVMGLFYFILKELGTARLALSTVSVLTSFLASYLTFMRSSYYAVGYMANDLVLIGLWVLAAMEDASYLSMVICFVMFFLNDLYGFLNWQRMKKRQAMPQIA